MTLASRARQLAQTIGDRPSYTFVDYLARLRRFTGAFAGCGLVAEALTPAYGLAEATLYVVSGAAGRPPRTVALDRAALQRGEAVPVPLANGADGAGAVPMASCGLPVGQHVAIEKPDGRRHDEVGARAARRDLPQDLLGQRWERSTAKSGHFGS